jgi:hypothetical protein
MFMGLAGLGVPETVREESLVAESDTAGLSFERQRAIPLVCNGKLFAALPGCDRVIDDPARVGRMATGTHALPWEAPFLTFLRLTGRPFGMLLNPGQILVKDGIHHVVRRLSLPCLFIAFPDLLAPLRQVFFR